METRNNIEGRDSREQELLKELWGFEDEAETETETDEVITSKKKNRRTKRKRGRGFLGTKKRGLGLDREKEERILEKLKLIKEEAREKRKRNAVENKMEILKRFKELAKATEERRDKEMASGKDLSSMDKTLAILYEKIEEITEEIKNL